MFGRVAIYASAIALTFAAAPASAIPIQPDPDTTNHNLVIGQTYEYSDILAAGSQVDLYFTFTLTPPMATTTTFTVLNLLPGTIPSQAGYGISNLFAQWNDGSPALQLTEADGDIILLNTTLAQALAPRVVHEVAEKLFVALGNAVWEHERGPAEAVSLVDRLLKQRAGVR